MNTKGKVTTLTVCLVVAFLVLPVSMYFSTLEYSQTVSSVPLPYTSSSGVYDPQNGLFYVPCQDKGNILIYNASTQKMVDNVSTGGFGSVSYNSGITFDPHNGLLYFEEGYRGKTALSYFIGLVAFNTLNNSMAKVFDLGGNNFIQSIVLNPLTGYVFVSEGQQILLINDTKIVSSYKINNPYNDDTYFAFNPHTNTSYLLYLTTSGLFATNKLTPTNTTFLQFNRIAGIYFMEYVPGINELLVGSSGKLYSIDPANIDNILFTVNLTSKSSVGPALYSSSLDRLYVAAGATIQVINATTGSTAGTIRMGSQIYSPSGISQTPNGNFLVTDGPWLYLLNDKLNHLEPYYPNLLGALILSSIIVGAAASVSFGILYSKIKKNKE